MEQPELGACRDLAPGDVAQPANATKTVDCAEDHTAETYAVGALPARYEDVAYDDPDLGKFAYKTCSDAFEKFLGADESPGDADRGQLGLVPPVEEGLGRGCAVVPLRRRRRRRGVPAFVALPESAKGLLLGRPKDRWLVCATGPSVAGNGKVPCNQKHTWRAVTTIKVGLDTDDYPGDRLVEVKTKEFCSDSVGAWMNYPVDYDFAYTWFHEAEWEAGNRRSVCWARTEQ